MNKLLDDIVFLILAVKKEAIIPDQLVKKLKNKTLIQRAIDLGKNITKNKNIIILTDSEEISLIAKRNEVEFIYDKDLRVSSENILNVVKNYFSNYKKDLIIYRANTPLLKPTTIFKAYEKYKTIPDKALISVKKSNRKFFSEEKNYLLNLIEEIKSFYIINFDKFKNEFDFYFLNDEESIEIDGYYSWWVIEKLLERKRIVFNVIGNKQVGMGHIYRALSLAHEINDHEILFVCNENDYLAVEKIASKDYKVIKTSNVLETILELQPDLVINDCLNTKKDFIKSLKKENIKVVNFEDLGDGVKYADLVINELYDEPILPYSNILWGYEYFFVRDEFEDAKKNIFNEKAKNILITFGGTDQHNLTLKILKWIEEINIENDINIKLLCGSGYLHGKELEEYIKTSKLNIKYFKGLVAVSHIMENVDFAISSNGRTVYELAHMNIPSIIISQHERENTHNFSKLENGFINLGVWDKVEKNKFKNYFTKLLTDREYRYLLYLNTLKYDFTKNKKKVIAKILELLK